MKNNNRNRKLKFIREKNRLRLGKQLFKAFCKVPESLEEKYVKMAIDDLIEFAKKDLFKKFRLNLRNENFRIGQDGRDFIMNVNTIVVELNNIRS